MTPTRTKGVISTYYADRGFGFIQVPGEPDLFFHVSALLAGGEQELQQGVVVEFGVECSHRGLKAVDLRIA